MNKKAKGSAVPAMLIAVLGLAASPNQGAAQNNTGCQLFAERGDIVNLPWPLKSRLITLSQRPRSYPPLRVFEEAPTPSRLFGYYLLDTGGFQPNVFTATIPGINSGTKPTATGANHDLPTIAAVRMVVEPKPGLPVNPNDPGAFIDIFTDISGLFVINNESGWYEGWMIHDLRVPPVAAPRPDGHAQFGTLTAADANALAAQGDHHNIPGRLFTLDGSTVRPPSNGDHFPDDQSNLVSIFLSMGTYNALQQSDVHSYWEFNQYTDWVFPTYELAFTGGIPGSTIGECPSVVPGPGPGGSPNDPNQYGDDPNDPRDPDRAEASSLDDPNRPQPPDEEHLETRNRFIPSGLAREILVDVYMRLNSFEPNVTGFKRRLFDAYVAEVARIDENADGVVSFEEADEEDTSDGGQSNERLFIPATRYNRFAVTREINDGLLAPRFAPSQRAWVLTGSLTPVNPPVDASIPHDDDNRSSE
jgi:hypothetical protein